MPSVLSIEDCFDDPWSEKDFLKCLRKRNCIGMVVEHNECILGYMVYEISKHSLSILNFAVGLRNQRRGVGTAMINKLIGKLSSQHRDLISVQVRESNLSGQLFFSHMGFRATKILKNWYGHEDAYVMEYVFNEWNPKNRISKFYNGIV